MCPNSFCSKCLSCIPTEVYLPLSEERGLCNTCMALVKMIEFQETIEGKTSVNFEDSETVEFLFKEYWLLMKRFHGYKLTTSAFSCAGHTSALDSSEDVKRDVHSTMEEKSSNDVSTATTQTSCTGFPAKEPVISVPKSLPASAKRRRSNYILPAKKKIRVLKLLIDTSSEDDNEIKPSSSDMVCGRQTDLNYTPMSAETIGAPSLISVEADDRDLGAESLPFSAKETSSPKTLPQVLDGTSQPFLVAPTPPPPTDTPQPKIHPPSFPVDYSKLLKEPHSKEVSTSSLSENDRVQTSTLACDGLASRKAPVSESALPIPQPALASTCKPFVIEKPSALPDSKPSPQSSNVSCKALPIKSHSLAEPPALDQHLQLPEDTSKDTPSSNIASCKKPSLRAKPVSQLKRPHSRSCAQESCKNVNASLSTCDKAETSAPITVQSVSRIYLRRSRLEELLSDQTFPLLIMGAFVRIRHSKHENNYRLVPITGTSTLQDQHYYQVGERKTNVVLEVSNLNKQQRIKIDHVSNHMFTEEECQRLQQSVELGFISAPTVRVLEEKAAALQQGKAKKCLDEKLAKLASKVKAQIQIYKGEQVQADEVPVSVESTTKIAESESKLSEVEMETALVERNGVGNNAAWSLCQHEKRQNECPNCGIDEMSEREIQNNAEDGHVALNEAQTAAEKQEDDDQESDISEEMSTSIAGQNKIHSPKLANPNFTKNEAELNPPKKAQKTVLEVEAELTPPRKAQKKGLQDFGCNKYLIKEHWPCLMAEIVNHAHGDVPVEAHAEIQMYEKKHMNVIHCDVGVDLATNNGIGEDRTGAGTLSSSSAVDPVTTSNLPQGIPLKYSQDHEVIKHSTDNHTGMILEAENQGCAEEYVTTDVELNDSGKRAADLKQWFYQDIRERTFGPFSLQQLRKWNRTQVFPLDLKIWRAVAGQKSSILLVDALNAQEMEVILQTDNSIAVESCWNPSTPRGSSFTESGSACLTLTKEMFHDGKVPTSKTDWQSHSAHVERRHNGSTYLGDSTTPIEQVELNSGTFWTLPQSSQFNIEEGSVEKSQEHLVMHKEFGNTLNVLTEMITDDHQRFYTSATETSVNEEKKCRSSMKAREGKSNPEHTQEKETYAGGEKGISAVKEIETCMEDKSSRSCTEQDTLAPLDDGWSLSEAGKLKLGVTWSTAKPRQFEVLKDKATSVQRSPFETPGNFEVQVTDIESEIAMQQRRRTIADTGLNSQSLAEDTPNRKREHYSHTERQVILTLDEGWNSFETCNFELETWATQYDTLKKKEALINKCRDEILSNSIFAVTAEGCKEGTAADSNCHKLAVDTSVYGNNTICNTEQKIEILATLDDGWGSPGKVEQGNGCTTLDDGWGLPGKVEQGTCWGSPNATADDGWGSPGKLEERTAGWGSLNTTCFNQLKQKFSMVQSCHDKRSSNKLHSKQVERENTHAGGVYDGIQKDNNSNLCGGAGRSLSHDRRVEKDQRRAHSSQGYGRAQRIEDTHCKGSSRNRDMSLSKEIGCLKDFCHLKSKGGRARKLEDHAEFGKGSKRELKRSHSRESIMWSKEEKFRSGRRYFSSERTISPITPREVETVFMRSHSRKPHEEDRFKRDQKSFSKELVVSAKNGYGKEEDVWTSHSRSGLKYMTKERRASPENDGNRMERGVRRSHARNGRRSTSREQRAFPESAGQNIEKDSRRLQSWKDRRSISRKWRASPENARYREGKRSRDYRSRSRCVDDGLTSRFFPRELRESSAWARSSAHRFSSRTLVDGSHRGASMDGRWKRNSYTPERFQCRERASSPSRKELIQVGAHVFCPRESTLQPIQTSDQGWTPPHSPSNHLATCWSTGIARV